MSSVYWILFFEFLRISVPTIRTTINCCLNRINFLWWNFAIYIIHSLRYILINLFHFFINFFLLNSLNFKIILFDFSISSRRCYSSFTRFVFLDRLLFFINNFFISNFDKFILLYFLFVSLLILFLFIITSILICLKELSQFRTTFFTYCHIWSLGLELCFFI